MGSNRAVNGLLGASAVLAGTFILALSLWGALGKEGWPKSKTNRQNRLDDIARLTRMRLPPMDQWFVRFRTGPPVSWLGMTSPMRYLRDEYWTEPELPGSCAVVGSSGNLTDWGQGKLIDSHDHVLRFNYAPTAKFVRDVGSRTTHSFLNKGLMRALIAPLKEDRERRTKLEVPPGSTMIFTKYYMHLEILLLLERWKELEEPLAPDRTVFFSPTLIGWMLGIRSEVTVSIGLKALLLAVHLCDTVSIFGFGADPEGNWDYYYKAKKMKVPHNVGREASLITSLAALPFVTLYPGNHYRVKKNGGIAGRLE